MKEQHQDLPSDIRALLDSERSIQPLSAALRGRAVARARAAVVAGAVVVPVPQGEASRMRWVVAACLTFAAASAIGAGTYQLRARLAEQPPASVTEARPASSGPAAGVQRYAALVERPAGTPAHSAAFDELRQELRLLRLARAAVARRDFAAALSPITEHTRRFSEGHLAEEREALRVRALAGLGRTQEARHAADSFAARFPRSVLLPAVRQMID